MQWESNGFYNGNARQPPEELMHYGIRGQKWGIRRFQNEDRTLTAEGKLRYGKHPEYEKAAKGHLKKAGSFDPKQKTSSKKDKKNSDPNARENWKSKDVSKLSDEELRQRNNRLQAEQNYKNSVTPEWKKTARQWGKEAFKALLITSLTTVLAESLKETIKPDIKKKFESIYKSSSQKVISSLNKRRSKKG